MAESHAGANAVYSNVNGFPLAEGKTLHMDLGRGDLANRIVTVGSTARAELIAKNFDTTAPTKVYHSSRGFSTYTGYYHGTLVSVVAIGMGPSMMDFFVRESRAIVDGPMAIVRYGTCGGLSLEATEGKIAVASQGSGYVIRNPDAFVHTYGHHNVDDVHKSNHSYIYFGVAPVDDELTTLVKKTLTDELGGDSFVEGTNVTAESFYSSQGRIDDRFEDHNHHNIDEIKRKYPHATSMEMETFQLLHLAKTCKIPIKASAACIVVANRLTGNVIHGDVLHHVEEVGGRSVLHAVAKVEL